MPSNLNLTPFQLGEEHSRNGLPFNYPYLDATNNREYREGYNNQLRRTAGVKPGQEQPLP